MKRGHLEVSKSHIKNLHQRKSDSEKRKRTLIRYLENLKEKYRKGELTYARYVELIHQKRNGRTIEEWIHYYHLESLECHRKIQRHQNSKAKKRHLILIVASIFLLIFISLLFKNSIIKTGFVSEGETTQFEISGFIQNTNIEFSQTEIFEWQPENQGQLHSIKLTGYIQGQGNVKVYLDDLLILDSSNIQESGSSITALAVKETESESQESTSEATEESEEIPVEEETSTEENNEETQETEEATEEQSPVEEETSTEENNEETQETEENTPETEQENQTQEIEEVVEEINETISDSNITEQNISQETEESEEEQVIKVFKEICEETCTLRDFNLSQESYSLRIEISGDADINIEKIHYEISAEPEEEPEEIISETNATVTTQQFQAVIGQPVKWKKEIKLEEESSVKVKIPKNAENITAYKIQKENQGGRSISSSSVSKEKIDISLTGMIISTSSNEGKGILTKIWGAITGYVVDENKKEVEIQDNATDYELEYYTEAPQASEEEISNGKRITITGPNDLHYENILAYTELENELPENRITLYHIVNDSKVSVEFDAYDLNENGLIDYIEWVVPHLSEQVYELSEHEGTFFEGFESNGFNTNNWTITPGNYWVVNTAAWSIYAGSYGARADKVQTEDVLQVNISTQGYENINVSLYWKARNFDNDGDYYYGEWYNGTGWTEMFSETGTTGSEDPWINYNALLSSAANNNANFALRFRCYSDDTWDSCIIDNINITGTEISSENVTITETVEDSIGTELNVTLEIEDENNITIYNETSTSHNKGLAKGRYKIKIRPKNHKVKEIEFKDYNSSYFNLSENINDIVDIDDPEDNQGWNELYAINPLIGQENDTFTVTATASEHSDTLYKCTDWNFTTRTCFGEWTTVGKIIPGEEYTFTFTIGDPALAEGNGTFFEGWESNSFDTNNWTQTGTGNIWYINPTATYPYAHSGSYYAEAEPRGGTSNITTIVDTTSYANISFSFWAFTEGLDGTNGDEYIRAYWYDGTTWTQLMQVEDIISWTQYSYNLSSSADNNANLQIRFTCTAGNNNEQCQVDDINVTGTLITDATPPNVNLSHPPDNYVNDTSQYVNLTFNATVADNFELSNCSLWHNYSGTWQLNQTENITGTSNTTEFTLNYLTNKTFIWNIQCFDNSNNEAFDNSNRTVILNWTDDIPPNITINSPINDTYTNATILVNISSSDNNLDTTWYNWNGTNITYTSPINVTFNEASNILYAYANDTAGNENSTSVTFFVDTFPPAIFDLRPTAGTIYEDIQTIEISANVTNGVAIDTVYANITYPNNTLIQLQLNNSIGDKYNNSFTIPYLKDQYNVSFFANDSSGKINDTETTDFTLNDSTPPRVTLIHPWGYSTPTHYHDENDEVDITVDVIDLTAVDTILANVTFPNQTSSVIVSDFGYPLPSDDFNTDTEGINWIKANITSNNQICYADIDNTFPEEMFLSVYGASGPSMHCAYNSLKRVIGNYDMNITFNITHMEDDSFFTFRVAPTDTLLASGLRAYIAIIQNTGGDRIYRLAYYNGTTTYQDNIATTDTYGKFRIKRSNMTQTGTPVLNLYYWNNTGNSWIESSFGNISIPELLRPQVVQIKPGSQASNYGAINITIDDFQISQDNYTFALFNQTSDSGNYSVQIIANDTSGYVNDTESATFEIEEINNPPSRPFFEEPDEGDIVTGLFNISWGQVTDDEDDSIQFNITLLNPNNGTNATIVTNYGNINTTYYEWNTTQYQDGNYSIRIVAFENETAEGNSNTDTLDGNFTIDNSNPEVEIKYPINHTFNPEEEVAIVLNINDTSPIDTSLANITSPNTTLYQITDFIDNLDNDNFNNNTLGTNWEFREDLLASGHDCYADINNTIPGKLFMKINGSASSGTTDCGLSSLKRLVGDFDMNITFNITHMEEDNFFVFRTNNEKELNPAGIRVFISLRQTSTGRQYRSAYVNSTGINLTSIDTTDTYGKFRIKKSNCSGTPIFNTYYWNNTGNNWVPLISSAEMPESDMVQFAQIYLESSESNLGTINVSVDDFETGHTQDCKYAIFNRTSQTGQYNISVFVNDTLGFINDTETTIFQIISSNTAPSTPIITNPSEGDTIKNLINISWLQITDNEGDSLRFNITLLNPDLSENATITTDYGDNSTIRYEWNTTQYEDGDYNLRVTVYENETAEGLSNSGTITNNFTIDNTPPLITINSPINDTYTDATILVNISSSDNNLDTTWYKWNGTNITYTSPINVTFNEGSNTLYAYANDTARNENSASVTFTIVTTKPKIAFISPTPNDSSIQEPNGLIINVSVNNTINIDVCTLDWNGTNESMTKIGTGTNVTCYSNKTNLSEAKYTYKVYANNTVGNTNVSETRTINISSPPSVIIYYPDGGTYDINRYIAIQANITDNSSISEKYAEITFPNNSKTNESLFQAPQADNFDFNTVGIVWNVENSSIGPNQNCIADIDTTITDKAFTSISGDGFPNTDTLCSLVSKHPNVGDFDMNVTYNITNQTGDDIATNFQLSNKPTSTNSSEYMFMSWGDWNGHEPSIDIFIDDGHISEYVLTREASSQETEGKFRIKRQGNNFTFYTWNNTLNNWNQEHQGTYHFDEWLFITLESESKESGWGGINVTWDDLKTGIDPLSYVGEFNQTSQTGTYNVTIYAKDNLGAINNTEQTNFTIQIMNDAPSVPFLLTPSPSEILYDTQVIRWSEIYDEESDSLRFNITLLNPDESDNTTITSNYGDSSSTSYTWNTTQYQDGNYSLKITVYENETSEKYNKTNILDGNFTIDNTPPNIEYNSPTETSGDILYRDNIQVNVSASDEVSSIAEILIYLYDSNMSLINQTNIIENNTYFVNFTNLSEGIYYFNATAHDETEFNQNSTETRNVTIRVTPDIILNASDGNELNYTTQVLTNYGEGIFDLNITLYNEDANNIVIWNYNDTGCSNLTFESEINETWANVSYAIDPGCMIFDNMTVTVSNATGNYLYKCLDFNMTSLECNDEHGWTTVQLLTINQAYNFTINSTDPAFIELLQPNATVGKDAFIRQGGGDVNKNYGITSTLSVDSSATSAERSLLEFNVSDIPSNATITNATIELYKTATGTDFYAVVYRLTNTWEEGTGDSSNNNAGVNGTTWNERWDGLSWTTTGGDYNSKVYDNVSLGTSTNVWISWNITQLVQEWVNGTYENKGLIIKASSEAGGDNPMTFASSDNANNSIWPRLNISYTTPENNPPNITYVSPIANTNPTEASSTSITFYATMYDENGVTDLNDTSVKANFTKTGEPTRENLSCTHIADIDANSANYSCTIDMEYFDEAGNWNVTVYGEDNNGNSSINDSTYFQYNQLQAIVISPSNITFNVTTNAYNQTATNDPTTINNTGNANLTNRIVVNALDLLGETNSSESLKASNFTVGLTTGGSPPNECSGIQLQNATDINITNVVLNRGNLSLGSGTAQEELYYCIKEVGIISSQNYTTQGAGNWLIKIALTMVALANTKKKKRKKRKRRVIIDSLSIPITIFTNKLGGLEGLVKYLKENIGMTYHEIAEILNRDDRTIWTAYNKSIKKQPTKIIIKKTLIFIPISILKNRKVTVLEAIIIYLKDKGMKYVEIAELLNRDQRNIWTIHSRAIKK